MTCANASRPPTRTSRPNVVSAAVLKAQRQGDPEGGIPSGSLEFLGGETGVVTIDIGLEYFRLMSSIVSFVSW
jgi:hypothetical protein